MQKDRRCLDYQKAISESEQVLLRLERRQSKDMLCARVRFLRLLKSGACTSQANAGKQISLGLCGSETLWKKYRSEVIQGLLLYLYQGTGGKLFDAQKQRLEEEEEEEEELAKDQTQSLQQAALYEEEHFGVHYTVAASAMCSVGQR
jgi:hypothetical protein